MVHHRSQRSPDTVLRGRLQHLGTKQVRLPATLRVAQARERGVGINHIYSEKGLRVRKYKARRKAFGERASIRIETRANARWSLDFVHDQFGRGRRFRVLIVVD
jgi:putative transposase